MSTESYNLISATLSALTLIALLLYTLYTYRLLLATRAAASSTQSELEVMQQQLEVARSSADATMRELEILQGQLLTARQALDVQQERELRAARPILVWRGGSISSLPTADAIIKFQNQGGPIAIIETRALHCAMALFPANYIPKDGQGSFSLGNYLPNAIRYFGIKYVTGMNEVRTTIFRIEVNAAISPRLESAVPFDQMSLMPPPPQPVEIL